MSIKRLYECSGFYGSHHTPCTVFCAQMRGGYTWYAVEDSKNVNCTFEEIEDGVDVELLDDHDYFYWSEGIADLEQLETAVES